MIIFLLSLIPVSRTEIGDREYFSKHGFYSFVLSFCVCAMAYMYFLLGHTHNWSCIFTLGHSLDYYLIR